MAQESDIVNPLEIENWDSLALSTEDCSIFHSAAWARVLHESYNYQPCYFAQMNSHDFRVLVPLMEVASFITGRRGVSLPFTDVCESIFNKETTLENVLEPIIRYGENVRWKYIELRGGGEQLADIKSSNAYFSHVLELNADAKEIFKKFRSSTKRNIKKALKEGVEAKICYTLDAMKEFYRLNCLTRKFHGLPPQPWYFFKKVHEHILSKNHGFVVQAIYDNRVIASSVYFLFGHKAIYKWGASGRKFNYLRANNLVMWKAIEWCIQNKFKTFDFGRTEKQNRGLLQFKRGWRGKETIINYYKYDIASNSFVKDNSGLKSSYHLFKLLPNPLLKAIGALLYRHVG